MQDLFDSGGLLLLCGSEEIQPGLRLLGEVFTEQRFVHGLEGPLDARGTLSFEAPDKLVRRTLSPRVETMAVEGNTLTLSRGGRNRTLTLDSMPELLGLVEAMRGTLTGDGTTLQRYFRSAVSGSAGSWTLDLTPIDSRRSDSTWLPTAANMRRTWW